jgi:hypothetical protein
MEVFQPWDNCVNEAGIATLRCVPIVFQNIVTAALMFAGVVALFFIITSGYKFMTSGGDPKAVDSARKTMIYAILGLVLILCSFAIVQFISFSTGVKCVNSFGFDNCDTVESNPDSIQENTDIGDTVGRDESGGQEDRQIDPPGSSTEENDNDQGNNRNNRNRGGKNKGR